MYCLQELLPSPRPAPLAFCLALTFTASGVGAQPPSDPAPHSAAAAPRHSVIAVGEGEKAFMATDINNDQQIDLLVALESRGEVVMFINRGRGRLERAGSIRAGKNPSWLTVVDVDEDGVRDIAVANHEADNVTVVRGLGNGEFDDAKPIGLPISTQPHSHMIAAADLNGDRRADLVVDSRDRCGVFALLAKPGGGFDTPGRCIEVAGRPYLGFALADFDRDGFPDIVTPNQRDLSVMLNRSEETLAFERSATLRSPAPFAVAAADVNGDAIPDVIAASEDRSPGVTVFQGKGNGQFAPIMSLPFAAGAKNAAAGDVNGDGYADVVVTNWDGQALAVLGGPEMPTALPLMVHGIRNAWGVVLADFTGDGRSEVVIGDATSDRMVVYDFGGGTP